MVTVNDYNRALSALNHLDSSCPREHWVRIAMSAKVAGVSFDDFHSWSKTASNYKGEKDCRDLWESIDEQGGLGAGTLFAIALARGWCDPRKSHSNSDFAGNNDYYAKEKTFKNSGDDSKQKASDIWKRCLSVPDNYDYVLRKQGNCEGLRYYPLTEKPLIISGVDVRGYLVIPCWSNDVIQTLQFIPPNKDGKKLNLTGASFGNGFFTVGKISKHIYICEGVGQAWAVNKSTGHAAVVCFGAGRMLTVAKVLRAKYPDAHLVFVPDRGKEFQAAEIALIVDGYWVEMPNVKASNYDANDYLQEFGCDALAALLELLNAPKSRFRLLSGSDLCNAPPMRWLVQGVIPAEGLAALYGASGSGKSFLILDIGCAVASGGFNWFGLRVIQAPVTYICLEGEAGIGKRIKAWCLHHNNIFPPAFRFITQPFDLFSNDVEVLAKIIAAAQATGGLVILDTLNRAAPGADENSSVDMGNIIASAKKLQSLIGGLVLLVHHTGKDATKGLRGHSSLYAALDGAIEVVKTDTRREWSVSKSKDDVTGASYPFRLDIIKVGLDENEEITSCAVSRDESVSNAMRRTLPPKSGNQKIIWEALCVLFRGANYHGQGGAPTGRPCIRLEEAIEKTRGRLVCEQKRQSERTKSAISGLVVRGLLDHRDGWLWMV